MSFPQILSRFSRWLGHPDGQSSHSCARCRRVESCGLPPSADCVLMLEQAEIDRKLGIPVRRRLFGPLASPQAVPAPPSWR